MKLVGLAFAVVVLACVYQVKGATHTFTSQNGTLYVDGQRFYLKGVSWFGFETSLNVFHGLWAVDYNFIFDFLQSNGFNGLRVPFNLDMVLNDPMPTSISYGYCSNNISCNLDLKGLTSLQVLDKMFSAAAARGIAIMLDLHSFEPDAYASNGLWYDSTHPVSMVLQGWQKLVTLFGSHSNWIAVDLKNEPFACTWDVGVNSTDWRPASAMIGNYILGLAPQLLIVVEGVASSPACAQACFYGEDLQGVAAQPVQLSNPLKLVYSPHSYGPSVYNQPYFSDPSFPNNMPAIWDTHFGFIRAQNQRAVVPGEWGGQLGGADGTWLSAWVSYLTLRDMTGTFFWCVNPDSGDTGGLLENDWITPVTGKLQLIAKLVPNPTHITF